MKKIFSLSLIVFCLSGLSARAELCAIKDSPAFSKYKTRIKSELSKLIYLLDRFNSPEIEIKIDGNTYKSETAFPFAKAFLSVYYKKEKAEAWINKYCYRSPFTNQVMLACIKGQECIPGRDLLLNELKELRKAEQLANCKLPS